MLRGKESNSDDERDNNNNKPNKSNNRKDRRESNASNSTSSMHQSTSSSSSSKKDLIRQLTDDFAPGEFDVICSRGKWAMNAPGNIRYRSIIKDNLQRYSATTSKQEKSAIVSEIVESIQRLSPQGGFVRSVNGKWYTVTDHIAREKTGQSFRDALHHQYRSSTKAKRRRQKERKDGKLVSSQSQKTSPQKVADKASSAKEPSGIRSAEVASNGTMTTDTRATTPALSLSSAASQVFPNIPSRNSSQMMTAQLAQHHPPPHPPMHTFSMNNMTMAQYQQQFQQQAFMYHDLNHMHQNFPMHNNIALPNATPLQPQQPQQEPRIAIGDLEPIPIREEVALPTTLMQQQQQQQQEPHPMTTTDSSFDPMQQHHHGHVNLMHSAQVPSQLPLPLHLQDGHQHYLQQMALGPMQPMAQLQHQQQQYLQPQALRQQLEPLPFHDASDRHPDLPAWGTDEDNSGKGDSFEGMTRGGGRMPSGEKHDDDHHYREETHSDEDTN